MAERADAVIAGGGLIGASVAWALRGRGLDVAVADPGAQSGAASAAAAGMLSPFPEVAGSAPAFELLARTSLDRFPAWVAALCEASGIPVEFRALGKLHLALTEESAGTLRQRARQPDAAEYGLEWLERERLREEEPAASPAACGALLVGRDASVDNRALTRAAAAAAAAAGVNWLRGERVVSLLIEEDGRGRRAAGVRLAGGGQVRAGVVVIAAGCWSAGIAGLDPAPPVRPVRGQMLAVQMPGAAVRRVVATESCYLVPRGDGRLLIGATVEEVGFEPGPTPAGIAALATAAAEAVPLTAKLHMTEAWAGFRPGTPDALPLLGPDPVVAGVLHATGHYRNGILLAPVTADIIAALATGAAAPVAIDAFSPARFGAVREER
jgi:glycine oxidase